MLLIKLMMALFYSSVPVSHEKCDSEPETEAAKWNSAIIHFNIYTCAFYCDMLKCLL